MGNDETHIIHRILKGETSLYEYFLDKYSQQVFILIIRIVENQEDAEELTQDTFLKAFEHLSSFKAESSFSTWIYRIAYNTAISATRKRKQELIYKPQNKMFYFCKTFCSKITLVNTIQNVI